jgi:hypothetical protein
LADAGRCKILAPAHISEAAVAIFSGPHCFTRLDAEMLSAWLLMFVGSFLLAPALGYLIAHLFFKEK